MLAASKEATIGEQEMQKRIAMVSGLCLSLAFLATQASCQQDKSARPSPPATAQCALPDGKTIIVDYSSPRVKGRKIFGEHEPYGKVWRAGANEATTFVTTADLKVGGKEVPAGSYTIFAIPNPESWTLIISKKTGEWGTDYPGPDNDLARVDMKVSKLPSLIENFTIAFDKTASGCTMRLEWETTRASVEIIKK
jgi:Protein of unknown function (DUF2911)